MVSAASARKRFRRIAKRLMGKNSDGKAQIARFKVGSSVNSFWKASERGKTIYVESNPLFSGDDPVFAMGSCFAVEIRNALRDCHFNVLPEYFSLGIDRSRHRVGKLPERDNINHYDTFVIEQEIRRAVLRERYRETDFWQTTAPPWCEALGYDVLWQDPYRRDVYGVSQGACKEISDDISEKIDRGLEQAKIIIITLGLTEVWRNKNNGRFVCQGPRYENDIANDNMEFYRSTFSDNKENLESIVELIKSNYPEKKILFTVSPVALGRTYTNEDVVVANLQSKTTLRAAAGEVCASHEDIIYWPSFEFAMAEDVFLAGGRHVKREAVNRIVEGFLDCYVC